MRFAAYLPATGEIRFTVDHGDPASIPAEFATIEAPASVGPGTHYVLDGQLATKGALPSFDKVSVAASGADVATITGLPNPTRWGIISARVGGQITDGTLALTFDTPGAYTIQLDAGPAWLRKEVTIRAT